MESGYPKSKTLTLNNGLEIPRKGLGTFCGDNFESVILEALDLGYRHIDTAKLYRNEKQIGEILEKVFKSGKIKREELWITTKIYNEPDSNPIKDLKECLEDLKLDYVDMVLIHWPFGRLQADGVTIKQNPLHLVWAQMEECVNLGLTKSIGVSNFNCQILCDLLSYCKIKPVMNQIEIHPYNSQIDLVKFCQKYGIQITAFASLCRGGLQPKKSYKIKKKKIIFIFRIWRYFRFIKS